MHQHSSFSKRYRFADKFFTADAIILGFGGFVYFGDYVITGPAARFSWDLCRADFRIKYADTPGGKWESRKVF